ncbi:hypothetical protein AVEN_174096-1 [Araneus ventricosus]|uniref:Secreted protein n=1 Tax=Araneus ventricosus TaxID=182803 RepID=A0A4Y2C4Q7_ARAVE|nr:hypothetical protein AVEN_174096-1 [Araneus ventricosus]
MTRPPRQIILALCIAPITGSTSDDPSDRGLFISRSGKRFSVIVNGVTPVLPYHPEILNDSRCNSSSTEAGHPRPRPDPSHRMYVLSLERDNLTPAIIMPSVEVRIRLPIRRFLIRVLVVPSWGGKGFR